MRIFSLDYHWIVYQPRPHGRLGPSILSFRLMVVGSEASPVTQQVFHDAQAQLSGELAVDSLQVSDLDDQVTGSEVLADPAGTKARLAISLRSDVEGFVLVKGLAGVQASSFDVLGWNLALAADAGLSVVYAADASGHSEELVEADIRSFLDRAASHHASVSAVVLVGARGLSVQSDVPVLTFPLQEPGSLSQLEGNGGSVVTPLAFKVDLLSRAAANPRTIVLPESEDLRILEATRDLLAQKVANIVLIGDELEVRGNAQAHGLDIDGARIVSTTDPVLAQKYAAELARIRSSKGLTEQQAATLVADPTYFATMMVQMGDADGMVSGATHTTAETIRPAFQIIKTAPGAGIVSSAFLMLMEDHVLVLADCAVVVSPNADDLAKIAVASAGTAAQFGLTPLVALLSYSTGSSGSGPSVDVVREAAGIVSSIAPELAVEGPIQFDAAVDQVVAQQKAPTSRVAGKANVLVFPDLNAGNIAYKAIQRTAGAVAVGPILQGLNKPVNDLSRGALVEDIVNTVAITAIQAGGAN